VGKLEGQVRGFGPTKTIIDLIFLAGIAGIIAGLSLLILPDAIQAIPASWSLNPSIVLIIMIIIVITFLLFIYRARRRS
jgi:hypothetical protein